MTLAPAGLHAPRIVVAETPEAAALDVAARIEKAIRESARMTLGLATGKTPRRIYRRLVDRTRSAALRWGHVTCFNLDEYVGLASDHPASFHRYMRENLFDGVGLKTGQAFIPDGLAEDLDLECRRYEEEIRRRGGIDLQLLGIGTNGHIGFNEPGSPHDSRCRPVRLAPSTIAANAADFSDGGQPPGDALTMGIGTILEAREILLIATGAAKADAIHAAVAGPVSIDSPASALRRHPAATIVCDRAAAEKLLTPRPYPGAGRRGAGGYDRP